MCLNKQGTLTLLKLNSPKEIMQDNHVIIFGSAFSKEISSIQYFMRANTTRGLHITHERFTFEYLNKKHVFFIEGQNSLNFKMSKSIEISTLIIILKVK